MRRRDQTLRAITLSCVLAFLASCGSSDSSAQQSVASVATASVQTPTPTPTPTPVAATDIDVILVLGQSNATGYQSDRTTSYVPDLSVLAWNGSSLTTYSPNVFTGIEGYKPGSFWAAEMNYVVHYRAAYPLKKLLVLRYTAAGTQLASTGDSTPDWSTQSSGELLDGARTFVRTGFAALRAQGYSPHMRIVWWQQGENDAFAALAPSYLANLTAFVAALRDQSGDFAVPAATPIAIGRLSNRFVTGDNPASIVRAAQTSVAHADVGGPQVLLDDDDLPFESDGIHLTKADQLAMGDRLWAIDQGTYQEP